MMKKLFLALLFLLFIFCVHAQKNNLSKPKLIVGLVVDQMRWDYLYKYNSKYNSGLKRLINEGFSCENTMINYLPSVTAIGHASIFTGSVPSIHGIAGNDWIDNATCIEGYCTDDSTVNTVGAENKSGKMSPKNLWSTTITDELRMASNFKSKVVGVSLKDRASILPAGHNPTAAFWYDDISGNFVTSTYYMNELPKWVIDFNTKDVGNALVSKGWNTLLPIEQYTESTRDNVPWENNLGSSNTPQFPYNNLASDYQKKKGIIRNTPFGNTLSLDFAKAAIEGYALGNSAYCDFITINCASTDYVGHAFGPNSIEVQDVYLRLDKDLGEFFSFLDKKLGKNNYLVFLTADHGAAHSVGYMQENKMPSGYFSNKLKDNLNELINQKFNINNAVISLDNYQVHFNNIDLNEHTANFEKIKKTVIDYLSKLPEMLYVVDQEKVSEASIPKLIKEKIINGYNSKRSGAIQFITKDNYLSSGVKKGTTHSAWNPYDTHIPLIFMGWKIKPGKTNEEVYMTDIAPTISAMLQIPIPSGCIGKPIVPVLQQKN